MVQDKSERVRLIAFMCSADRLADPEKLVSFVMTNARSGLVPMASVGIGAVVGSHVGFCTYQGVRHASVVFRLSEEVVGILKLGDFGCTRVAF